MPGSLNGAVLPKLRVQQEGLDNVWLPLAVLPELLRFFSGAMADSLEKGRGSWGHGGVGRGIRAWVRVCVCAQRGSRGGVWASERCAVHACTRGACAPRVRGMNKRRAHSSYTAKQPNCANSAAQLEGTAMTVQLPQMSNSTPMHHTHDTHTQTHSPPAPPKRPALHPLPPSHWTAAADCASR